MSQEHVEIMRKCYDGWNRGDFEAWFAPADPEVELVLPFTELEGREPLRGREGARQLWDTWRATFPDASFQVDEVSDLGDTTFVAVRVRGHGASSDVPVEQPSWHVVRWRGGKVIRMQAFLSEADALKASRRPFRGGG